MYDTTSISMQCMHSVQLVLSPHTEECADWVRQMPVLLLVSYHLHSEQQVHTHTSSLPSRLYRSVLLALSESLPYRLFLKRGDLDNLQKSRVRRSYPPSFSVELQFEQWTEGAGAGEDRYELVD